MAVALKDMSKAERRELDRVAQGVTLIRKKRTLKRGEWLPFLKEYGVCIRTAQHYMRLAREYYGNADHWRPMRVQPDYTALTPAELGRDK